MGLTWLVPTITIVGSALLAAPIIVHLLFRQKPKRLPFPALRLIQQRQRTLIRKLRLRHLLLLALRILLLGGAIIALGRPIITGGSRLLPTNNPIAALLVFDTSASMGYQLEGQTRLQKAQALATEYLRRLPEGSKVAVVDSAEPTIQFRERKEAQVVLESLQIRYHNRPVLYAVREVLRRLQQPDRKWPDLPLVICIFSDRTAGSWNSGLASEIRELRAELARNLQLPTDELESRQEPLGHEGLTSPAPELPILYFDLAPPRPINVAITGISLVIGEGALPLEKLPYGLGWKQKVQLQVEVRGVGAPVDTEVELLLGEQVYDVKRFQIQPPEGQSKATTVRFRPFTIEAPMLQGRVRLKSPDMLDADTVRYWTLVAQQQRVWLVAEQAADTQIWRNALETLSQHGLLPVEVSVFTTEQLAAALAKESPQVLCILNVSRPTEELWQRLSQYVKLGGRLVLALGADLAPAAYNTDAAAEVLPLRVLVPLDLPLDTFVELPDRGTHPLFSAYRDWNTDLSVGRVYRVWQVELLRKGEQPLGLVLARVSHEARPLVIERYFDSPHGSGRVLVFTTPLYRRTTPNWSDWNNFHVPWQTNFALPLVTVRYLLQAQGQRSNWLLGEETPSVLLPGFAEPGFSWELRGPETRSGTLEHRQRELFFDKLDRYGNYTVRDLQERWLCGFSVNLPPHETEFLDGRISDDEIRSTFGEFSLLEADSPVELVELARTRLGQAPPLELLPWLLMLVVVLLAVECWVANRFYKPETAPEDEHVGTVTSP